MPSEFKLEIEKLITKSIEGRATSFSGIIVDYDHKNKLCTVEISNPTGAGHIRLYNRSVPEPPKGVIPGDVRVGAVAVMTCPQGQYTHAKIVAIEPPGEYYTVTSRPDEDALPRDGKTIAVSGRLRN
jgi:hypothetical protein